MVPKFPKKNSVIIWGAICGANGGKKSPVLLWNKKDWGNIIAATYIPYILKAQIWPYWYEESQRDGTWLYVMEDDAAAHKAKVTQTARDEIGIESLQWVASSPDLNPIEAIWRIIKYRIARHYPKPTTQEEVCTLILAEWAKITSAEILSLIDSMPERIKAVIEAEGGHTHF